MKRLDHYWYNGNPIVLLLLPLSWLFCALATLRRWTYRRGVLRSVDAGVPVVVVGNITVGGSGKTPLVVWLVEYLREAGLRVGVISRGYGGRAEHWPQVVTTDSDPRQIGDEPLLIVQRTGCPLVVGPDRVASAQWLREYGPVDVIISDDGMQHYRLKRTVEIAVVDAARGLGNGHCLPAGPLRERPRRLAEVDMVVTHGGAGTYPMNLKGDTLLSLANGTRQPLSAFTGQRVHAVAGIGHPRRFFAMLRDAGLEVVEHAFDDHYSFSAGDIDFRDGAPVVMTEKDAVKCRSFAQPHHWMVPVRAEVPAALGERVLDLIRGKNHHG